MKNLFLSQNKGEVKIIPEGMGKPGHIYTVSHGKSGMIGKIH
jgi:ATP-dependent Lon protease